MTLEYLTAQLKINLTIQTNAFSYTSALSYFNMTMSQDLGFLSSDKRITRVKGYRFFTLFLCINNSG